MRPFKFLNNKSTRQTDATPQDIRNSPYLSGIYREGWNAAARGVIIPPNEYYASVRVLSAWAMGHRDSRNGRSQYEII
jgi:hypothetical protein